MRPEARQSIVWAKIERLAFRPHPHNGWITLYQNTLHDLWEMQPYDIRWNRGFAPPFLNIYCDYVFESLAKYSASIDLRTERSTRIWDIHVDPTYKSKSALYNETRSYPHQDYTRHLRDDVERVLDGMLFHPRNHTHIEELGVTFPAVGGVLDAHEVRISGAIENFYVFLFHLRYQFCLIAQDTRDQERTRLVELFASAIVDGRQGVSAADLFNFRR